MSYRSNLSKARGLGSAMEGSAHWVRQRVSAIAMIFLVSWLGYFISSVVGASYHEARALLTQPLHALCSIFFVATAFYHSSLGIQVVIEDYVHHPVGAKLLLISTKLLGLAAAGTGLFAIFSIYVKG